MGVGASAAALPSLIVRSHDNFATSSRIILQKVTSACIPLIALTKNRLFAGIVWRVCVFE